MEMGWNIIFELQKALYFLVREILQALENIFLEYRRHF